jgi:predicted protein tyrosine phosphatase
MSTPLPEARPGVLAVGGFSQASRHGRRWDAILTCEDPGERQRLRMPDRPQLVLAFEDCDDASLGYAVATRVQVEEALAFMRENREGSLLVHCTHGVGRSTALALMGIADRMGKGREDAAMAALLGIRPECTPNLVVVGHADDILGRDSALMHALTASEAANPGKIAARRNRRDYALNNPGLYARADRGESR